jgi:RND family efflux transporter MFP subunit
VTIQDLSKLKIDRSKTMLRPRRYWPWVMLFFIVLTGIFGAFFISERPILVETVSVSLSFPSQRETVLNATGYAVAQRKASLSSKATGRLEWLGVLEGSRVKKGELIARLENRDVAANLQLTVANLKVARANLAQGEVELVDAEQAFRRSQVLLTQQFISAASHDTAQARVARARASITGLLAAIGAAQANERIAQVALDQTLISAPFDGIILTKNANVGDNITPFSSAADSKGAVVTIADMDTLEVEADVSESSLAKIRIDQPCEVQFDAYPDLRLAGVVARMVPTVDRAKATLLVKVRFLERDPRVLPDMSAKVAFLSRNMSDQEKTPLLTLPIRALTMRDGKPVVLVLRGNKVQQVVVAAPQAGSDQILVQGVAGVKLGDKVVSSPDPKLRDGDTVRLNQPINPTKPGA